MTETTEKSAAVAHFIALAKGETSSTVTREKLDNVLQGLIELASRKDWWSNDDYAEPEGAELQSRYFVHQEPDNTFALYLNVMKPGKQILPHNHTTWACIAAVEGTENNYLYERLDDRSQPAVAKLSLTGEKLVSPGGGVALMADDIHAVQIMGQGAIRHLHMYGLALESLTERVVFDTENDTCKRMSVGVKTQRIGA